MLWYVCLLQLNVHPRNLLRYLKNQREYMQVQIEADDSEIDIIGIYHSHPDWPPIPSQTDMASGLGLSGE